MLGEDVYGTVNFSSSRPVAQFCKDDYIFMELLSHTFSYFVYKRTSEEKLQSLVRTDELTGLPNRRATMGHLSEQIEQSHRSGQKLSVLSIDIDYFKSINDQWGHASGDIALAAFARVASDFGRKTDFCGRIGGEEFVFFLCGADVEAGQHFGNELRKRLAVEPIDLGNGTSITLNVSAGVAMLDSGESLEGLLARADNAMYKAKRQRRDRVCQ